VIFIDKILIVSLYNPFTLQSQTLQYLLKGESTLLSTQLREVLQNRSPQLHESHVWLDLRIRYGSGVTIKELDSISRVLSTLVRIAPPSYHIRRSFRLLINWYESNWASIEPILPMIQLRDEHNDIIDGNREILDQAQKL
jgi:hypothetical protein